DRWQKQGDAESLLKLWVAGADVPWSELGQHQRVSLPGYPFDRQRYWSEEQPATAQGEQPDAADTVQMARVAWRVAEPAQITGRSRKTAVVLVGFEAGVTDKFQELWADVEVHDIPLDSDICAVLTSAFRMLKSHLSSGKA